MLMKRILLFASAALLFAGCAKENITPTENPDNSQKGDITLSFSASQTGFGTKAVIGETTTDTEGARSTAINWQSTDQISVFDGNNQNCALDTKDFNAETPTSCTFEGTVTAVATDYTAVYPYTEGATISEGVISGISLPATQTAVEDSFDPKAALMAAKTVDGGRELAFKNLVGYVKVTTDFECKQIELCAASKEALAGEGTITFTDGTPSFTLDQGAESTITLRPAGEGTTIAAGKTYYIAVPAGTLAAGWNISFTATDDKVYTRQGTKQIQFKTNTVINLGTIKLDDLIPYVTFTAESEQTFNMYSNNFPLGETEYFEYSVGGGEWVKFREIIENIKFGGSHGNLRLRGKSSKGTSLIGAYYGYEYSEIRFTTKNSPVDCTGDIRTLIDYENYANASTTNARFCKLFFGNEELRTAPSLPAQSLASRCYYAMFSGCTSLTTAPELPAETLADYCYDEMFLGCTKLTKAPELPAETLADNCYNEMFSYCTKLTTVTSLPAYELAEYCYLYMFTGCESLTNLPKLPYFEKLSTGCFKGMFSGCKALATAPELHVIFSLAANCFESMFYGCTKLSSVKLFIHSEIDNKFNPHFYLSNWLNGAGTDKDVDSPQLYLGGGIYYYYGYLSEINSEYLNNDSYFPEKWRVQPLE